MWVSNKVIALSVPVKLVIGVKMVKSLSMRSCQVLIGFSIAGLVSDAINEVVKECERTRALKVHVIIMNLCLN